MKAHIAAASLKRLIQATHGFVGKDDSKPVHRYIRLEFSKEFSLVTAISVDGYRMSVEHASCDPDEDFVAYIKANIPPCHKSSWATIEVKDRICYINIDGNITGYQQPEGDFIDWKSVLGDTANKPKEYRVGFNGDLLLSALQAAKASVGNVFRSPIILEFRGPLDPALIKTNKDDYKMVMPVRLKAED